MDRPSIIAPVYKSIIRALSDYIEELNLEGTYGVISYHNFESRGDENSLPQNTLIGTDGFGFDENQGRWIIRFALAVSSFRDYDLLNEVELLDHIQRKFGEGEKIYLREMVAGEIENELVVSAFKVLPMGQSELRNYRTIGMELLRTGT